MDRNSSHSHSRIIQKILDSEMRDSPTHYDNCDNDPLFAQHQNIEQSVEMVIQVDSQRSATLVIKPGDNPTNLAQKFCFQHNIDPRIITALSNNIKNIQNTQFRHKQSTSALNMNTSIMQKQNQSGYMNTSLNQSNHSKMNESFKYKGQRQSLNKQYSSSKHNISSSNAKVWKNNNDTTLMSNDNQRQSVFDRLYHDSKKKKYMNKLIQSRKQNCIMTLCRANSIKKQNSRNSIDLNQSSSICLMIYDKNTKAKQEALLKRQLQYQLQKQKQIQNCTFRPQINPISDLISQKLRRNPYGNDRSKQKQLKKIKEYLNEKEIQQMKQCTFQPKILSKSKIQQTKTQRFQLLYQDHYARQTKRRQIDKKLSDSRNNCGPKINSITTSIIRDRTFAQRLRDDQSKRQQHRIQRQQQIKAEFTGRPQTGRAPKSRDRSKSVGERLYNHRKSSDKFQAKRAETPKVIKKSQQLYEVNKKTAFRYLFTLMDSDEDGLISHTKINIGGLGDSLLRLVMPLLIELEEVKAELDEQQFVQSFNRLFNTFNILERQIVLNVFKHSHQSSHLEEPSFQPSLNQKSLSWARQCRPYRVDMYEQAKEQEQRRQAKYYEIRALKQLQEMQECTFHPMLFK